MAEKIQIKAVEMVRRIRDEQAQMLAGKSKMVWQIFLSVISVVNFFRIGRRMVSLRPKQLKNLLILA